MPSCNKMDTSCNITWRESGQTSVWSFLARELVKPMQGEKQMTVEINNLTGASPNLEWHSINWKEVQTNVNRLQVRLVKAVKETRWNKAKALQHLLTRSFSGKVTAVKRV